MLKKVIMILVIIHVYHQIDKPGGCTDDGMQMEGKGGTLWARNNSDNLILSFRNERSPYIECDNFKFKDFKPEQSPGVSSYTQYRFSFASGNDSTAMSFDVSEHKRTVVVNQEHYCENFGTTKITGDEYDSYKIILNKREKVDKNGNKTKALTDNIADYLAYFKCDLSELGIFTSFKANCSVEEDHTFVIKISLTSKNDKGENIDKDKLIKYKEVIRTDLKTGKKKLTECKPKTKGKNTNQLII